MEDKNRFLKELAQTNPSPFLVEVDYAEGIYIYDKSEKKYMDLIAGLALITLAIIIQRLKIHQKSIEKHLHVMVYGEFVQRSQMDFQKTF